MKRHVLFALLCLGVGSVLAIAASIPEPVRTLSQAEKADVIAGCYNCDSDCAGDGGCKVSLCTTIIGLAYATENINIQEECNEGGSLIGECETPTNQFCCQCNQCKCYPEIGEEIIWYCEHYTHFGYYNLFYEYSNDPC